MKFLRKSTIAKAAILVAVVLGGGCVQYPTERQSVVDQRPQISFRYSIEDANRLSNARVLVDGLDSGRVSDFADGTGALRVLPGTHTIRVVNGDTVILDERVYLSDGVARPFVIK